MTITIVVIATVSFLFGAMLTSAWWMLHERPALDLMSARINVAVEDIREYGAQIGGAPDYQAEAQRRADHKALWSAQTHVWHDRWIPIGEYTQGAPQ